MVEIGSPEWRDFPISVGDDYVCQDTGEEGSFIVLVNDNRFVSMVFTHEKIDYGTILRGKELEQWQLRLQQVKL